MGSSVKILIKTIGDDVGKQHCNILSTKSALTVARQLTTNRLALILGVTSLSIVPNSVLASGYQLLEHSAAGLGRAFSGESVIGDNASILAGNAAGLALLDRPQLSTSLTYISVDGETSDVNTQLFDPSTGSDQGFGAVSGSTSSSFGDDAFVPAFFYARPLNDKITYGFGVFSDFGLSTDYGDNFSGRLLAIRSEVVSVNFNPSFSYRINDSLSVGLGISYVYVEGELSSATFGSGISDNPALAALPLPPENRFKLTGSDTGWGANLGVLYEISETTRVGFGYRSMVEVELEGDGRFSNCAATPRSIAPACRVEAKLPIDLPEIISLSAYHELSPVLAVHGGATHTRWSRFDELFVDFPEDTLDDSITPEEWTDSTRYAIGLTYKYSDQWTFRTGYTYDNSPVPDRTRTLRIPDNDRQWLSLGLSYQMQDMSIDVGYAYLSSDTTDIDETRGVADLTEAGGPVIANNLQGRTDTDAHVLGVQFNYLFK